MALLWKKKTVMVTMASFYNFQSLEAFRRRLYSLNGPRRDARLVPKIFNYFSQLLIEMLSLNKINLILNQAKGVCHDTGGHHMKAL